MVPGAMPFGTGQPYSAPSGRASSDLVADDASAAMLRKRYRLVRVIGSGSAATVYEVEQIDNGRTLALKVLARDVSAAGPWYARFQREMRITASLVHPNICRLHDCGTLDDGRPYYVMDLLDGEPLSARIQALGKLAPPEAVDMIIQLLAGLRAAHAAGVVHRDIKPENVFLHKGADARETVKLLDFGACTDAALAESLEDTTRITRVHGFLGSPFYMAPEQIQNARAVDPRADLWSVGVVLYEALCGKRPFTATSLPMLLVRIATEQPPRLIDACPGLRPEMQRIVDKALAKDRHRRYQNATAFLRDLIEIRPSLR